MLCIFEYLAFSIGYYLVWCTLKANTERVHAPSMSGINSCGLTWNAICTTPSLVTRLGVVPIAHYKTPYGIHGRSTDLYYTDRIDDHALPFEATEYHVGPLTNHV